MEPSMFFHRAKDIVHETPDILNFVKKQFGINISKSLNIIFRYFSTITPSSRCNMPFIPLVKINNLSINSR